MIKLYSWRTPNGQKLHIALEEVGIPYELVPVDLRRGEQKTASFGLISPNHKIPAIVDDEGPTGPITIFESGAILIYLAEKTKLLLPRDPLARYVALEWLMFQMSTVGPTFGRAETQPIPDEVNRVYAVLDRRLAQSEYLGGPEYSIADIATFTWARHAEKRDVDIATYPNVKRWLEAIERRRAVKRGLDILKSEARAA